MAETTEFTKALAGEQDILRGDSTTPVTQTRLDTDGTETSVSITPLDSANYLLSTYAKTALGLSGTRDLDDLVDAVVGGTGLQYASPSQNGQVYRTSAAPATPGQPIVMEENDARVGYIPSSAQKSGLGVITSQSVSLTHTPSSTNGYATANWYRDNDPQFGTGKDGVFTLSAITDPATAPSGLSTSTTGGSIPSGTYSYKITYGNASGETLPSSASSTQATTGSTSIITMTIPVGGAGTAWRKIYRDDGGGTWRLVGYLPENVSTSFTDTLPTGGQAAPGSNTTGATWGTPTGEWHFDGDMTLSAATTVGTSGAMAGILIIRCRGTVTLSADMTANGAFPDIGASTYLSANDLITSGYSGIASRGTYGGTASSTNYGTGGGGFGSHVVPFWLQGAGGDGSVTGSGTAGTGGAAGGCIFIYAHSVIVDADITCDGTAGSNASGTTNYTASGGGGGSGGFCALVGRDLVWIKSTRTVSANGANGGNGAGQGGATKGSGGGGGGGGYVYLIAPVVRNSGTAEANNGTGGTQATTGSSSNIGGGGGGGNSGNGGNGGAAGNGSNGVAGQVITASSATGYRHLSFAL